MVQGLNRFKRKLRRLPAETKRRLQADLSLIGRELNVDQRGLVPVDKGDLSATIRTEELGGDRIGVNVRAGGLSTTKSVRNGAGVIYDYALAQEFGTEEAPPNPFFFSPYRLAKRRIRRRVRAAIRKAVRSL